VGSGRPLLAGSEIDYDDSKGPVRRQDIDRSVTMPTLAKGEAVEKLIESARGMGLDDLLDFHNELFPEDQIADLDQPNGCTTVRQKVLDYLGRGIEVEEILDLWNVAFPEAWNVSYDDETDTLQYLIEPEAIGQVQ
jgi:hypothetical protein